MAKTVPTAKIGPIEGLQLSTSHIQNVSETMVCVAADGFGIRQLGLLANPMLVPQVFWTLSRVTGVAPNPCKEPVIFAGKDVADVAVPVVAVANLAAGFCIGTFAATAGNVDDISFCIVSHPLAAGIGFQRWVSIPCVADGCCGCCTAAYSVGVGTNARLEDATRFDALATTSVEPTVTSAELAIELGNFTFALLTNGAAWERKAGLDDFECKGLSILMMRLLFFGFGSLRGLDTGVSNAGSSSVSWCSCIRRCFVSCLVDFIFPHTSIFFSTPSLPLHCCLPYKLQISGLSKRIFPFASKH